MSIGVVEEEEDLWLKLKEELLDDHGIHPEDIDCHKDAIKSEVLRLMNNPDSSFDVVYPQDSTSQMGLGEIVLREPGLAESTDTPEGALQPVDQPILTDQQIWSPQRIKRDSSVPSKHPIHRSYAAVPTEAAFNGKVYLSGGVTRGKLISGFDWDDQIDDILSIDCNSSPMIATLVTANVENIKPATTAATSERHIDEAVTFSEISEYGDPVEMWTLDTGTKA